MSVVGSGSCGLGNRDLLLVVGEDRVQLVDLLEASSGDIVRLVLLAHDASALLLDLLDLLDHQLAQHRLANLRDRHDRLRATTALVGGGIVRSVVALVAHVCHSTFVRCRCQVGRLCVWTDCGYVDNSADHVRDRRGDQRHTREDHDRCSGGHDRENCPGDRVCVVVVALVLHAISIPDDPLRCKPLERYSANISHFVVSHGVARGYAWIGHDTVKSSQRDSHPVRG